MSDQGWGGNHPQGGYPTGGYPTDAPGGHPGQGGWQQGGQSGYPQGGYRPAGQPPGDYGQGLTPPTLEQTQAFGGGGGYGGYQGPPAGGGRGGGGRLPLIIGGVIVLIGIIGVVIFLLTRGGDTTTTDPADPTDTASHSAASPDPSGGEASPKETDGTENPDGTAADDDTGATAGVPVIPLDALPADIDGWKPSDEYGENIVVYTKGLGTQVLVTSFGDAMSLDGWTATLEGEPSEVAGGRGVCAESFGSPSCFLETKKYGVISLAVVDAETGVDQLAVITEAIAGKLD